MARIRRTGNGRIVLYAVVSSILMVNACGQSADVVDVTTDDTATESAPVQAEAEIVYAYGFGSDSTTRVIAFDSGTGETLVEASLPWEAATSLVVAAGSVWVGTDRQADDNLLRMDADTLETQASLSVPDSVQNLYTDGSSLIALTFSGLTPIDTSTNAPGTPYALYRDQFPRAAQVETGSLYSLFDLGAEGSALAVYDAATGEQMSVTTVDANGSEASDIAVVDGIAWVSLRYSGNVVRVDPALGQVLETLPVLAAIPTSEGRVFGLTRVGSTVWAHYTDDVEDGVAPLEAGATAKPDPIAVAADTALVALDEDTALGIGGFGPDVNRINIDGSVEPITLTTLQDEGEFTPSRFALGG